MFSLDGKSALVTGASRGIGAAIAIGLARAGADVAVLARSRTSLDEVAREIRSCGRRAVAVTCDVTDHHDIRRASEQVFAELPGLDILVGYGGDS